MTYIATNEIDKEIYESDEKAIPEAKECEKTGQFDAI